MYKTFLLTLLLLMSAAWLQAQTSPQSDANQTAGQTTSGHTTVEGCLQTSGGNYTLTANNGTTYQLTGDTSKLSDHVGHEVKITGTSSTAASSTTAGAPSQATLEVKSMKHISKTCKAAMAK